MGYFRDSRVKDVKLQTLRRNFETFSMKDAYIVDQFMAHVNHTLNQLHIHGEDISNQKAIEKVLKSLLEKYDMVVVAIEESKDLSQLSLEQLTRSLLSHETRL